MVGAAVAALGLVPAIPATAAPVKPSIIHVVGALDQATQLAQPVKGQPFDISFIVTDDTGTAAPLKKATTFTVSAPGGPELTGTSTVTLAKGATGGTISGAVYSSFGNGIEMTVSSDALTTGSSTFNVLAQAYRSNQEALPGRNLTVSNPGCTEATPDLPVCLSQLLLPNGGQGFPTLSEGSCDGIEGLSCLSSGDTQGLLVEALADMKNSADASLYTRDAPATMVIRCDKTLCGSGGVPSYSLAVDVDGDGAASFEDAPVCPAKGVIASDGPAFCFDTVQSTRDNSGDLIAYVLFAGDVRASFK
jgi:hypothetical protein